MNPVPEMVIVGTGAMACLFGARLAPHARVTLLGTWQEGLTALQQHGVRLVEADGSEWSYPVEATSDPSQCAGAQNALVLVKAWQTERAASQLAQFLDSQGVALSLQNGLGNLQKLQSALGRERAALGVTTMGATLLGPGHVRVGGSGVTHVGNHPRLEGITGLLRRAGFVIEIGDNIESLLWGKLAINAGINPLTALLRVPNGELLARPHTQALMTAAAEEAQAVARARGIRLPYSDAAAAVVDVARRTASNQSSMMQDVMRGAPTEIDAICGAIAEEGERLDVQTPVNWTLWYLIRSLESSLPEEDL